MRRGLKDLKIDLAWQAINSKILNFLCVAHAFSPLFGSGERFYQSLWRETQPAAANLFLVERGVRCIQVVIVELVYYMFLMQFVKLCIILVNQDALV